MSDWAWLRPPDAWHILVSSTIPTHTPLLLRMYGVIDCLCEAVASPRRINASPFLA